MQSSASHRDEGRQSLHAFLALAGVLVVIGITNLSPRGGPPRVFPGNPVEARRVIAAAAADAKAHPSDGKAQLAYGLSLEQLGRLAEAIPVLERAEELSPNDAWPANALGWALLRQQQHAAAVPHLQRAVALNDSYSSAYHNLGWSLMQLKRIPEAEEAYKSAQKLDPANPEIAYEYSWALFQQRKSERAIAEVLHAATLDSMVAGYQATAGYFLRSRARFPEAKARFERAVALDSTVAGVWLELGMTDFLMADARGADSAFAIAARRDPATMPNGSMQRTMWDSARKGVTVPAERVAGAQMPAQVLPERAP